MIEKEPSCRRPRICVWELTLACNARCRHCGSSAGPARQDELSREEALQLIAELAALGCESVTFSGGEPLLREDWPALAGAVRAHHMQLELVSNGLLVAEQAGAIACAGFAGVTLSVDGTARVHDELRGVPGGHERLLAGARALMARGMRVAAVTQINHANLGLLEAVHTLLVEAGFAGWQLQLTMAHGRAAAHAESLCISPPDLPGLEQRLLAILSHTPMLVRIGDNIGYMSRAEPRLRSGARRRGAFWNGCSAGVSVVGIRSNGSVQGCLSLPASLSAGNVRERPLAAIWKAEDSFSYNRRFETQQLDGCCEDCVFGAVCRGGCRSLACAATGSPFSNPYCLFRVRAEKLQQSAAGESRIP